MRICLLSSTNSSPLQLNSSGDDIANQDYYLANGLIDLNHDVEVIVLPTSTPDSFSPPGSKPLNDSTAELNKPPAQLEAIVFQSRHVDALNDLNMLLLSTPNLHKALKDSFALWQTVLERHLQQPFDVIQIPERISIGILPALAKIAPVVVTTYAHSDQSLLPGTKALQANGDELVVKMFERLCIVTADGLCSSNEDSAKALAAELGLALSSIAVVRSTVDQTNSIPNRKELAKQMIVSYQNAITNYAVKKTQTHAHRLYLKEPGELLAESITLAIAFDKMIYDYLYQYSYRFRLAHWQRKAGKNPKQFARKALSRILRPFAHVRT